MVTLARPWPETAFVMHGCEHDATCKIHHGVYLSANSKIGPDVLIYPNTVIGAPPEHLTQQTNGRVVIEARTVIRELCTINSPTAGLTRVGPDCYIQAQSYIGHDALLEGGNVLAAGTKIGGHCVLMQGSRTGFNSSLHQKVALGAYSMVGMSAAVTKHVPPGITVGGTPARVLGVNKKRPELSKTEWLSHWENWAVQTRGAPLGHIIDHKAWKNLLQL